jgi:hypothetical protein
VTKFRPRKIVSERAASAFEERYAEDSGPKATNEVNATKTANATNAGKERATFYLPSGLLEELRNAVVALRGASQRFTMAGIVEAGVRAELDRLASEHNKGAPFPNREMEPYVGRPPK